MPTALFSGTGTMTTWNHAEQAVLQAFFLWSSFNPETDLAIISMCEFNSLLHLPGVILELAFASYRLTNCVSKTSRKIMIWRVSAFRCRAMNLHHLLLLVLYGSMAICVGAASRAGLTPKSRYP